MALEFPFNYSLFPSYSLFLSFPPYSLFPSDSLDVWWNPPSS